jgi:hypothetical protein
MLNGACNASSSKALDEAFLVNLTRLTFQVDKRDEFDLARLLCLEWQQETRYQSGYP